MNKLITLITLTFLFNAATAQEITSEQDGLGSITQSIEKSKADKVKVLVSVNGGSLNIKKGTTNLADIQFDYHKEDWDPSVSYTENEKNGKLHVKALTAGDTEKVNDYNNCKIELSDEYEYSLGILLGAGVATLNFEGFDINKALFRFGVGSFNINLANTSVPLLKIEAGIGEAKVDLSGHWKNDLSAQVKAGIGDITFYVPKDMGVKFTITGFLGQVSAKGFSKSEKEYTNDAFGKTKHQMEFTVNGAIGSINIIEK